MKDKKMTLELLHANNNKGHFSLEMDRFLVSWNNSGKQLANEFNSTFNTTFSREKIQARQGYLRKLGITLKRKKVGQVTSGKHNNKTTGELIDSIARVGAVLRFGDSSQSSTDRYLEQVIKNAVKADCTRYLGE